MLFRLRRARPTLAERQAPRLPANATRALRCYRCGGMFEASAFAESTGCARCGGPVRIPDITIDRGHWGGSLQTAGRIHVLPGCTVRASLVVASGDVIIEGIVHAMVLAGGVVHVTAQAQLRGGARCRTLIVEPGAIVRGGPFESHSNALGTVDIDTASRSSPGKGPAADVPALRDAQQPTRPQHPHRPLTIQPEQAARPGTHDSPEIIVPAVARAHTPRLRVVP